MTSARFPSSTLKTKMAGEKIHPHSLGKNSGSRQNWPRYFYNPVLHGQSGRNENAGEETPKPESL
jgi:hypothetical protein